MQRVALLTLALCCGCSREIYELDLRPEGDTLHRKLTFYRKSGDDVIDAPADEVQRLTTLYRERLDAGHPKKHAFQARFGEEMPSDVGGRGTYSRIVTSLGTVSLYLERFRGEDDLASQFQKRQQAAATLARLIQGWCEQELSTQPGYPKLKEFLETNLAKDLLNVSLYAWPIGPPLSDPALPRAENDRAAWDAAMRIAQYLVERDYFTVRDVPRLARLMNQGGDERAAKLAAWLIARKLGLPDDAPRPPAVEAIADPSHLERSWNKYLESTADYKQMLAEWEQRRKIDPLAQRPKPAVVYEQPWSMFVQLALAPTDELTLRLHLPLPPYATNGKWEEPGHVVWQQRGIDAPFPTLCFASWSQPDEAFQQAHFGKVVLDGQDLGQYCVWRQGLTATEAQEWEGFLKGLKPDGELVRRVREFRFREDPPADKQAASSLADMPRRLLLRKLAP